MADPWLKFYTSDWRADPRLKMCSLAARGLWIEMICLMHEASPYGQLTINGVSPTDAQLAVLVGTSPDQLSELLGELDTAGVFSRTRAGVIYSRKLTRMAKKSVIARKNGKTGGNPTLSKQRDNPASDNLQDKDRDKPQKPEARSQKESSSSSARGSIDPEISDDAFFDEVVAAAGLPGGRLTSHWMPPAATVHVSRWRRELGLLPDVILDAIRRRRAQHDDPPNGPKAFDRMLADLAAQIASGPMVPAAMPKRTSAYGKPEETPDQRVERWRKVGR